MRIIAILIALSFSIVLSQNHNTNKDIKVVKQYFEKYNCWMFSTDRGITWNMYEDLELINTLNIFPNPTSDFLYIDFTQNVSNSSIEIIIFDFNNNQLDEFEFNEQDHIRLDLTNYEKGIYFIKILLDDEFYSNNKFIIQ